MLILFFCICIYKIAEFEKRRGWLWALINLLLSILLQLVLVSGYLAATMALALSFILLIAANFYRPVKKGPTLS